MEKVSQTPGVDYPRTFDEMDDWFRTEAQCRDYIRGLCWPNGFVCERCGVAGEPWVTGARRVSMQGLRRQHVADGGYGVPGHPQAVAHMVSGDVVHHQPEEWHERSGSCSEHWAWAATKRLGRGCTSCAEPWCDRVVIDLPARLKSMKPTLAALKRASGAARSRRSPSSWLATEKNGRAIGRIRLKRVKDVSAESLLDFIREAVEPGATIHTDGWKGYAGLSAAGYKHRIAVVSGSGDGTGSRSFSCGTGS